jgi:ABC-type oligopeptide transport system ATPase subunit
MNSEGHASVFEVKNLVKVFGRGRKASIRPAVDVVSFVVERGEALGIVGESGSGKTTVGRILIGMETASAGEVLFEGKDVRSMRSTARADLRRKVQMVFQNPFASLNPFRTIRSALADGLARAGSA